MAPNTKPLKNDLETLLAKMSPGPRIRAGLEAVVDKLVKLHELGRVKSNHSVMEVIVAHHLLTKGYELVDVEHALDGKLVCDVFGVKGESSIVVEVETGFTPPENSLDPMMYLKTRIASKIARYSAYAEKFSLAFPPFYIPPIPRVLLKPPRERLVEELVSLKRELDRYYRNPPISLDELANARLHTLMVVDVDALRVREVDPEAYVDMIPPFYEEHI